VTSAIILAGGLGTRLRGTVPDMPKPMAPINGRPFLEHQLDYWIGQGVRHFVLSVGYKHEVIERHFGKSYRGAEIDYAVESEPLGTGGGLLLATAKIATSGPWLILNGDTFFEVGLAALADFHRQKQADITLSLFPVDSNTRYTGVEIDDGQRITGLKSMGDQNRQLINGGVYLMGRAALAGLPFRPGDKLSFENDLLTRALASGKRLYGHVAGGKFIDIGVPEDYVRAAGMLT
jgi:D-glycero-alpha-D-manno-heptose 1-phosphate guanylyltransferase